MEVARVERRGTELVGEGMQVGASYGLWYRLEPGRLTVQLLGEAPGRSIWVMLISSIWRCLRYSIRCRCCVMGSWRRVRNARTACGG
jgi:hypothetical protein